jgi:hypothetical protein
MPNDQPSFRIFACVKTRQDGRSACGNAGAREIMTALRLELARRGQSAAQIDVRPCGCLDKCERGPILMACTGVVAEAALPPRELMENPICRPKVCFEEVSVDGVPTILDQLSGVKN